MGQQACAEKYRSGPEQAGHRLPDSQKQITLFVQIFVVFLPFLEFLMLF